MAENEPLQRALALAYRYLNRRERTVAETRRYLERKDIEATAAEQAIAVLCDDGYLDDSRFARLFAEDKRSLEQWGSDRIRRGLAGHGVDAELIERAIGDTGTADDELQSALSVLRRRCPEPPRDRRARERALGILLRKGYEPDIAHAALRAHDHVDGEGGGASPDG